jgi:hypothetical protein
MAESDVAVSREAQSAQAQYRDWLIPVTVFTSISASIVIVVATASSRPGILAIAAAVCASISVGFFALCLLYAFTKLEDISFGRKVAADDGPLFLQVLGGIFFLFLSFTVLALAKSIALGISVGVCFAGVCVAVVAMMAVLEGGKSSAPRVTRPGRPRAVQAVPRPSNVDERQPPISQ